MSCGLNWPEAMVLIAAIAGATFVAIGYLCLLSTREEYEQEDKEP